MANPSKSQWDFGELFPVEATRKVLTVGELTAQVRRLLEKQVGQVWVTGEITNLRAQSSGHIYFTLKDATTQIACVLFRGEAAAHREFLADGQKLILQGDLTVYETRGQYQLIVRQVELQGVGALQAAFERLKQKLNAAGLFAPERKRRLPRFPQRLGLVTSPTGAAIRDVLHVIRRRQPGLEIILAPCRVQGTGAAEEIADALRRLNEFSRNAASSHLDLILVTRGGGSLEDLWAFNEEPVARAIFDSAVPVVSAVGHEIDFTICDFVADFRAATPSVAAEIITEGAFASRQFVAEAKARLGQAAQRKQTRCAEALAQAAHRRGLAHPRRHLNESWQRLDDGQAALVRTAKARTRELQFRWQNTAGRFRLARPAQIIVHHHEALRELARRRRDEARHQWLSAQARQTAAAAQLRLLSPENVLDRGYSLTTDAQTGQVIRHANDVEAGQKLKTQLKTGEVRSVVEK